MDGNSKIDTSSCIAALIAAKRGMRLFMPSLLLPLTLPGIALAGEVGYRIGCAGYCASSSALPPTVLAAGFADFLTVRDERMWVLLMEEPSAHMQRADEQVLSRDYQAAANNLRRVSAYLDMAAGNASAAQQPGLQACAIELAGVADTLAGSVGTSSNLPSLSVVFARAENAIAADHQARASNALSKDDPQVAGHFLSASIQHLENAIKWAGQTFVEPATAQALRLLAEQMIEGQDEAIRQADGGVAWLGSEVRRLQQAIGSSALPAAIPLSPEAELGSRLRF